MTISIRGLGTAVPAHHIRQDDAAEAVCTLFCHSDEQRQTVAKLYRLAGIVERGSVLLETRHGDVTDRQTFFTRALDSSDEGPTTGERMARYTVEAPPLAVAAARAAMFDASVQPTEIAHLVTVSCTGFAAPGFDIDLMRDLELPRSIMRTHIGFMGCHGALNGLRVARALVAAQRTDALVCAVELCTLHQQYRWDPELVVANSLFADGAAAAIVGPNNACDLEPYHIVDQRSLVVDDLPMGIGWKIGDHGFEMSLSPQVPALLKEHLRPWLIQWLAEFSETPESIATWAVHPGGLAS